MTDSQPPPTGPEADAPRPPLPVPGGAPPSPPLPGPPSQRAWGEDEPERPPEAMRPMGVGELLDNSIKLYRRHWPTFMAMVAVVIVPVMLVQHFLMSRVVTGIPLQPGTQQPTPEMMGEIIGTAAVEGGFALLLLFFVQPFLTAAMARAAVDVYLERTPTLGGVYRFALSRLHSILWVGFLTALATFGGFLLLVVPAIIFAVRFAFGSVVVVVEDERGTRAMRRSWRLTSKAFWKVLGTLVLAFILAAIVGGILQLPLQAIGNNLGEDGWPLLAAGEALGEIVTRPFTALVGVLLYFDQRVRKEGLDLQMTARSLGLSE